MIYSTNVLIGGRGGATKSVIKEGREGGSRSKQAVREQI